MNPYEILGVDPSAPEEDVKRAYRQLALKYHPDRNPGDAGAHARFKEINAAYAILSDPEKRAAYDRHGDVDDGGPREPIVTSSVVDDFFTALAGAQELNKDPGQPRNAATIRNGVAAGARLAEAVWGFFDGFFEPAPPPPAPAPLPAEPAPARRPRRRPAPPPPADPPPAPPRARRRPARRGEVR